MASLPPIGQTGRLHVAGRTVPVEVADHVRDAVRLELVEEGWTLTDGEARLVLTGEPQAGLVAGRLRVLDGGRLLFTPGALTAPVDQHPGGTGAGAGGEREEAELLTRRGRDLTPDTGQRRETFRVDVALGIVLVVAGRPLPARTINVSPTGCLLQADEPPRPGQLVVVRLPVDDDARLELGAHVLRVDGDRCALQFHDMDAAQERRLSSLLARRQREILRRR